ncbi:hypothetical protein C9374_009624 [Naegleria lovaniensis]|uniref:GOLD domain-containing protein n=1 Tax=Naegleria lovaniensis TaxID=51637 RepID=A0AA88H525_NAELO|nr:uncharacterized protein C9374_009624 [Naegleria lovaniensis]KAG2393047.1 hypothetical protein C9374_009624 [Naegleria lovaniensis]
MKYCVVGLLLIMFTASIGFVHGLTYTLDPAEERCFFESIDKPSKLSLKFQVIKGGFLDVDLVVFDPDGEILHQQERESEGKFSVNAEKRGIYKFCFSNKISTLTPKTVSFHISVGDFVDANIAKLDQLNPIEQTIMKLSEGLSHIQNEQQEFRSREATHRNICEATNERVTYYNIFSIFLLVCLSGVQVYYLRRWFEVKREI